MATYVPTNWKTGDVITATRLNNMETGIAGALQTSGGTMTGPLNMSGNRINGNAQSLWAHTIQETESVTDFNDMYTGGFYIIPKSKVSIDNSPFTSENSAFFLFVFSTSSVITNAYVAQIAITLGGTAIKLRTYIHGSDSWSDWNTIQFAS